MTDLRALTDDELLRLRRRTHDKIDAAYWRFCRMAKAPPPSLAEPEAYETKNRIDEILAARRALRRMGCEVRR